MRSERLLNVDLLHNPVVGPESTRYEYLHDTDPFSFATELDLSAERYGFVVDRETGLVFDFREYLRRFFDFGR